VLWNGGISFAGVIAFIFADLIVIPILNIYVLRRDAIRNERGGCDPTGASEETGRFAHRSPEAVRC
jgi:hypothetical protein